MLTFQTFLTEAVASEEKLTHLEHAEDHVINYGKEGFQHAFHNLNDVHKALKEKKPNNTTVLVKHDGSPSVVWGYHPETKKFFVASKSAFNKNPKVNYTAGDIEKNHGHAPGLVEKLKHALRHLPKVTPKGEVFQGDLMYTRGRGADDVHDLSGKYHFKPNTITYSTPKNSEEGKKIAKAKIGVLAHTAYKGDSFENMKADYTPDVSHFGSHPDVHLFNNQLDHSKTRYTPEHQKQYNSHMKEAVREYTKSKPETYAALEGHQDHLKTYINHTVRTGEKPTVEGYKEHLRGRLQKEVDKVKTDAAKGKRSAELNQHMGHIDKNKEHFASVLNMHHHLQKAKDVLVHALGDTEHRFEHHIGDTQSKPEGYVVVRGGRPTKLVDRAEFSKANFAARQ